MIGADMDMLVFRCSQVFIRYALVIEVWIWCLIVHFLGKDGEQHARRQGSV
jgi:hypothetical protein